MRRTKQLVYGVGFNDVEYATQIRETLGYTEEGKQIQKLVWICPFYERWRCMLRRCYSEKFKHRYTTYQGCYTIPE